MTMLIQEVNLVGVKIDAGHGFYSEEQLIGNQFLVDIYTKFPLGESGDTENLERTVNYEILYQIIVQVMQQNQKLLETLAQNMLDQILSDFGFLIYISVRVKKIQPPMGGEIAYSEVVRTFTQ